MASLVTDEKNKKWIIELDMDSKEDEKTFRRMISANGAYGALSKVLDFLTRHDDIHFEIHKIVTESNIDTSLL